MAPTPKSLAVGKPYPLGATWDGLGVNFAVFSAHADRIELCLFDQAGRREVARMNLPDCTDEVFHGYLPAAKPGLLYGYRAYGPYNPEAGHRFNPHKLLLDPYAKKVFGQVHWSDALFGYRVGSSREDLSFDRRDSAAAMPKAIVVDNTFHWGGDRPPDHPWADTIIYEAHLRGLTKTCDAVADFERGSFAALGDPFIIEHMVKLGITAVELMPVQGFLQDKFLVAKQLSNFWGYSTLSFFAPEPRYLAASRGSLNEVRMAVRRLHDAGIEVFLDVVYNHTCEGSEMGPTLSWRGFDNASYYRAVKGEPRRAVNDTGCGNTLNLAHPRVLQMVMDSLRHWVESYHIDGFRFDLGVTLGREENGFDPGSGFFDAVRQDPVLSRVKLISEPWDIGPQGYQLGRHPAGFGEWNDRFRDNVRRYWRGDKGQRPELAARLMGSSDIFEHHRRKPWASVNFVTAHDGFTLHDAVTYTTRQNEANGEDGRDGSHENLSSNWGVEGETEDAAILALRERVKRSLLMTLLFSHGTPMILAGDELCRTQKGNNNAYCQDNEISWLDWSRLLDDDPNGATATMSRFIRRLTALRKKHASLRSKDFLHGRVEIAPGLRDVDWFSYDGEELTSEAWKDTESQTLVLRRAVISDGFTDVTLFLLNSSRQDREFIYPKPYLQWQAEANAADPDGKAHSAKSDSIIVCAHSAVLCAAGVKL
jgi:glycogen operon protein